MNMNQMRNKNSSTLFKLLLKVSHKQNFCVQTSAEIVEELFIAMKIHQPNTHITLNKQYNSF